MGHVKKWAMQYGGASLLVAAVWLVLAAGQLQEATKNGKDKDEEILAGLNKNSDKIEVNTKRLYIIEANQDKQKLVDSISRKETDKKFSNMENRLIRIEKKVGIPSLEFNDSKSLPSIKSDDGKMKPFSEMLTITSK